MYLMTRCEGEQRQVKIMWLNLRVLRLSRTNDEGCVLFPAPRFADMTTPGGLRRRHSVVFI